MSLEQAIKNLNRIELKDFDDFLELCGGDEDKAWDAYDDYRESLNNLPEVRAVEDEVNKIGRLLSQLPRDDFHFNIDDCGVWSASSFQC